MTPRQRWLAALRLQPVDRLPFWPKLAGTYPSTQRKPYSGMSLIQIHEFVGSDQHIGLPASVREVRTQTSIEQERDGDEIRYVFHTPVGRMTAVRRFDPGSQSWHPTEFAIKTREDIRTMTRFYQDVRVEIDPEALESAKTAKTETGETGITAETAGASPLMHFVQWLAGIENCHFLLADYREEVEELFDAMQRVLFDRVRLAAQNSPADVIYLSENTSTTLISPAQYRTYCKPRVTECGRLIGAAGRMMVLHMCGHLKALLPDLAQVPAAAFESFTSPTVGNTTLLDGRLGCPDKCLIGGTNAYLWIRPAREIIRQLEHDLDALPRHRGIVVTSAGQMPRACTPETMKEVCDYVIGYPARM